MLRFSLLRNFQVVSKLVPALVSSAQTICPDVLVEPSPCSLCNHQDCWEISQDESELHCANDDCKIYSIVIKLTSPQKDYFHAIKWSNLSKMEDRKHLIVNRKLVLIDTIAEKPTSQQ